MATKILSAALLGLDAEIVSVEADAGGGDFGKISIVGLPDTSVSEARERVRSALRNCGHPYPQRKITVNLAPASLKKHGSAYDLPIAVAILALKNNFTFDFTKAILAGELSLNGDVKAIKGALSLAAKVARLGLKNLYLPAENAVEAKLIKNINVYPVQTLSGLVSHFLKKKLISAAPETNINIRSTDCAFDLSDIKGQAQAKRALEIAAAGAHNLILCGPPGAGKTLLARTMPSLLPKLSLPEILEITKIYSAAGKLASGQGLINQRPFRAPHHSATTNALIGGGALPRPGEISLAHRGVLFLDELTEFSGAVLENLRQPLETGQIIIDRSAHSLKFPARFLLLGAMNPCACGYLGDAKQKCLCTPAKILNYHRRLSGPWLDRIDMRITVARLAWSQLNNETPPETSAQVRVRVEMARVKQNQRFAGTNYLTNADLPGHDLKKYCPLSAAAENLLAAAADRLGLSARACHRVIKLARTIADLAGLNEIQADQLAEAIQYHPRLE